MPAWLDIFNRLRICEKLACPFLSLTSQFTSWDTGRDASVLISTSFCKGIASRRLEGNVKEYAFSFLSFFLLPFLVCFRALFYFNMLKSLEFLWLPLFHTHFEGKMLQKVFTAKAEITGFSVQFVRLVLLHHFYYCHLIVCANCCCCHSQREDVF